MTARRLSRLSLLAAFASATLLWNDSSSAQQTGGEAMALEGADAAAKGAFNSAPGIPPGEWHKPARDYANARFSPLDQIDTSNVDRLKVAWTISDGSFYGQEGTTLVVGDTMFIVSSFPNRAFALDLSKPGPHIKRVFDPKPSNVALGKACCDRVIRGWSYEDGKLIYNLLDNHTIALNAKTGDQIWRTPLDNAATGPTMTHPAFAGRGQGLRRQLGGRDGRVGLVRGARRRHRGDRVADTLDRLGRGRRHRPALQAFLPAVQG